MKTIYFFLAIIKIIFIVKQRISVITLKHLKVFLAVARTSSFVEAGLALHVSSSALSAMVRALEKELEFTVFERTTRSVRLTPEGERFRVLAETFMGEHQSLLSSVDTLRRHRSGLVRVATTQLMSSTIVPPAISAFKAGFPGVEVLQVPALYDNFQDLLLRKEVDFAVGPERLCDEAIEVVPLFASRLHLVCSSRHRFAARGSVRWKELSNERVFLIDKRGASWLARDSGYKLDFEKTLDVGHFGSALALTAENEGIMLAPKFTEKLLSPYPLSMVPLVDPVASRNFMLYRNVKALQSRDAKSLANHFASTLSGSFLKAKSDQE